MNYRRTIPLLFLISTIFFNACQSAADLKLAQAAVEKYHRLYNDQNYVEIFNSAHEEAKRLKSKEGLGYVLAESFRIYGRYLDSDLVYTKVSKVNERENQVELVYKSRFEKGTRNETFLIVTDGRTGALHSIGELSDEELERLKSK